MDTANVRVPIKQEVDICEVDMSHSVHWNRRIYSPLTVTLTFYMTLTPIPTQLRS